MVDFYASERHFATHMEPIFEHLRNAGYKASWVGKNEKGNPESRFAIAASSSDLTRATKERKMVFFMEHGAGQTYNVRNNSYAGGPGRDNVCLFLSPGPHVTKANKGWYPTTPSVNVGVPKLDHWHRTMRPEIDSKKSTPVVCISFHWDCHVCPETRSGFDHFQQAVIDAKAAEQSARREDGSPMEFKLIGHSHPRIRSRVKPFFEELNIPFYDEFEDVLEEADVYVCDNSSTIFEFASIGKPVVLLNPPMYRKNVRHGLRFWTYAGIGPNAHNSREMLEGIRMAMHETREDRINRKQMIDEIYYFTDGNATERAAEAILSYIEEFKQMEAEGNIVKVKRASLGAFGLLDPGQTVVVFPSFAVVNDVIGKFKRRLSFSDSQDPSKRIRTVLNLAPRNYELVVRNLGVEMDETDIEDFGKHGNKAAKGFNPVDRDFSPQEAYIVKAVGEGKKKTEICYKSRHLGEEYRREEMLAAWQRLINQEIIVPGEQEFTYEVRRVGSN